jgi:superkiller protein 3
MFRISGVLFFSFILLTSNLYGQLLGSSNGLGGSSSKSSSSKSASANKKKNTETAKRSKTEKSAKSTSAKSSNSTKSTSAKNTKSTVTKNPKSNKKVININVAKNATPAKNSTSNVNPPPQNTIVISTNRPTNGDFDELYEQAIDDGNTARDSRNYAKAETSYRNAQSLKPKDSRAIYGLGNIYSDQQRWELAEKSYRDALRLEPNSAEANIALSFVLTQPLSGVSLADRYTEAEKLARKAIELDANNAIAYDQLGVSLEAKGLIDNDTLTYYKRATELDSNFALAYAHLGRLYRKNGKNNESETNYRQAVRLSTDVPTMILVAEVMQSQQRYTESEQLLRKAIKEDDKNPSALFLLGRALLVRNSFEEAENILKTSLDISPQSFVPYWVLASVYQRKGNLIEAEKVLNRAIQIASYGEKKQLSQEFSKLSDELLKLGRNKDSLRVLKQALVLDSGNLVLVNKIAYVQKTIF